VKIEGLDMFRKIGLLGGIVFLLAACSAPAPLYNWGSYQSQVYALYKDPGKISFEEQIIALEKDYQEARSLNRAVPPGYHAHLGYLYFQVGKLDAAAREFETEKRLFPESTTYINMLLNKLKK
jgi:hypothetical protein